MSSKIEELRDMKNKYQEAMKEKGQEAVKEMLGEFFKAHEEVESVRWTQYTPYFNDGDTCEFNVHDIEGKLKFNHAEGEETPDYEYSYSFRKKYPKIEEALDQLNKDLHDMEDLLKFVFGDHAEIIATAENISVEEYQHD